MPTIQSVETILVQLPTRREHKWTGLTEVIGRYLLVRMTDSDGRVGWGEAPALKDWGGEFGRTVYSQGPLTKENYGRDHHPRCFSVWVAGGGIKAGSVYGKTDDFGYNIASNPVHVHDFQATLLHLLGFDHQKLTYLNQGRRFRLTDVSGQVVKDILA